MARTLIPFTALLIAMALAGTVQADSLDAASAAYAQGDYATAAGLLRPLAEAGNRGAQYDLGMMYNEGKGVARDPAEALKWFHKAADQGDAEAQRDIAYMYRYGRGVAKNPAEAVKWYRKAAERGEPISQFNLGFMYGSGEGTAPNSFEAYVWFALAVENLPFADASNRGKATRNRDASAAVLTPRQLADAQQRVREWKPLK